MLNIHSRDADTRENATTCARVTPPNGSGVREMVAKSRRIEPVPAK